eukprot:scaffold79983_cov34-Prasinocladus_malaysianus.AAC.1
MTNPRRPSPLQSPLGAAQHPAARPGPAGSTARRRMPPPLLTYLTTNASDHYYVLLLSEEKKEVEREPSGATNSFQRSGSKATGQTA